jgi:hypothetical protein
MSAGFVASRLDEQLSIARDFSSGFMPDRDYRSLTISRTPVYTPPWAAV